MELLLRGCMEFRLLGFQVPAGRAIRWENLILSFRFRECRISMSTHSHASHRV